MIFLSSKSESMFGCLVIEDLSWKVECQEKVSRSMMCPAR